MRAVIGPAPIAKRAEPLRRLGKSLVSEGSGGIDEIEKLGPGLRRAARAVDASGAASPKAPRAAISSPKARAAPPTAPG